MARRLVRDQAALIALTLLAASACDKRGCAYATGYAPEIGVANLDPLAFELWPPSDGGKGRIYFALGTPGEKDICPRLPDGSSLTLNGIKGDVDSLGGATSTQVVVTRCRRAEFSWREVPVAKEATSTIVVDDGKAKVECRLALGLPLRLATSTVKAAGDSVTLVVLGGSTATKITARQTQVGKEGEEVLMPIAERDARSEGNQLTIAVPTKWLAETGAHRLVLDAELDTTPSCTPARKTPTPSKVHVRTALPFTVTK